MDLPPALEAIVASAREALAGGGDVGAAFARAVAELNALAVRTELDRLHQLLGVLRLNEVLREVLPDDADLQAQQSSMVELIQRRYGAESPYLRSRSVVEGLAARLAGGEAADPAADEAIAALEALDFAPEDAEAGAIAVLGVQGLRVATRVLGADAPASEPGSMIHASLRMHDAAQRIGGFDPEALIELARGLREKKLSLDGTVHGHAHALMTVLGIGLRVEPSGLPALEPICELLAPALLEAQAEDTPDFAARCDAVLADFERGLTESGFSEYLFRQAAADLRELSAEGEDDAHHLQATLARLCEIAEPHAPPGFAGVLGVLRDSLSGAAAPGGPLDAAALRIEGDAIVATLQAALAGGEEPATAFTRAVTTMQALGPRLREDDDDVGRVMLELMPRLVSAMVPYADPDKKELAEDLDASMRRLFADGGELLEAGPADAERVSRSAMQDLTSTLGGPTSDPFEQPDAPAHQRQFASLLRPFQARVLALQSASLPKHDASEAKRIAERADVAMQRLRAATSEAQWLEQQRKSMRKVVGELRSFERRHHLMLIEPPWPAQPAAVDANAVFYAGGEALRQVVAAAAARIGMAEVDAQGVDDPVHARWSRMRRSAVAVFDLSAYDRSVSDPPGALPRSKARLEEIARAAAPVAAVAYECGWALVLGVPMLVLAREGQGLPFDIDVEPVRLRGDADDEMRIVLGLQAALLGTQRTARTSDLDATVLALRRRFGADPRCAGLIDEPAAAGDATGVRLGAEALLDTPAGRGTMLAWPALAPAYPAGAGRKRVFHVTAFRVWSQACEATLRALCESASFDYRIGYESVEPDILGAIWDDIAAADAVVADLTQLNPNAVLELGVAHAIGRPSLVLTQTPDLARHLPALAKVRSHLYATDAAGRSALERLLRQFLDR